MGKSASAGEWGRGKGWEQAARPPNTLILGEKHPETV